MQLLGRVTHFLQGGLFAAVKLTAGVTQQAAGATQQATSGKSSSSYLENLKSLNMSVVGWIGDHVRQNPYIDLSPVFQDYAKHLASITPSDKPTSSDEQPVSIAASEPTSNPSVLASVPAPKPAFIPATEPVSVPTTEQNGDITASAASDQSSREEDQASSSETTTGESSSGYLVHALACLFSELDQFKNCENDLMTVKSKLFYKKDSQYVELGIGVLHVEMPEQGSGVRLLMRNTTTIGQVLLNIRLTPSQPLSVQKNNLLVVSIPNPPLSVGEEVKEPQPVTYLLRVKTHEIANQLLSTIQKNLQ